jgi:uncharacterized repeat protein (TIGR04076 family)
MARAKITVVKKAFHQDLLDEYLHPDSKARGFGICTAFEEGQEFQLKGGNCPEGFCSWAWADIQRDVMAVLMGNGFPWVGPENTAITCCTDGFRPVTFKVERIEEGD